MARNLETESINASEVDTASEVKKLFASVLQPGEQIKVVTGQRVALNESSVGKPRDDLSLDIFDRLRNSVLELDTTRVEIPTTEKGNRKAPEFEVLAIGEKGPDGKAPTRTLFRQERGAELPISVNLAGDLIASLIAENIEEDEKEWSPSNDPARDDAGYYNGVDTPDEQEEQVFEEQVFSEETLAYFDSEARQKWEADIPDRLWAAYHQGLTEGRGQQALVEARENIALEEEQWRLVEDWQENSSRDFPSAFLDKIEQEEETWRSSQLSSGRKQLESAVSEQSTSGIRNEQRSNADEQSEPSDAEGSNRSTQPEELRSYPFGNIEEVTEAIDDGTFWDRLQNTGVASEAAQTSYDSTTSQAGEADGTADYEDAFITDSRTGSIDETAPDETPDVSEDIDESNLTKEDLNEIGRSLTVVLDYASEEQHRPKHKVEVTL